MLTTFLKKTLALVLSFSTLLGGVPAWAISTEEFIMNSWVGRPQEELLSAWGKPSDLQTVPGSKTHWIEYANESTTYVQPTTYTNTRASLNANTGTSASLNSRTVTSTSGGYYQTNSCNVSFEVDSTTLKIVSGSYFGNMCRGWYLYPAHVSTVGLNELKSEKKEIQPFQEKIDKSQCKVIKIRKDSHAYEAGLRNKDVILKSVKTQSGTELEIQRKEHWFSRSRVTQTYTFAPTCHSLAYEVLSKRQRRQFGVVD
jgi:hypothetical protein